MPQSTILAKLELGALHTARVINDTSDIIKKSNCSLVDIYYLLLYSISLQKTLGPFLDREATENCLLCEAAEKGDLEHARSLCSEYKVFI
jgi:hypothetical protein